MALNADVLRAYVGYLRDLGVHDLYRRGDPQAGPVEFAEESVAPQTSLPQTSQPQAVAAAQPVAVVERVVEQVSAMSMPIQPLPTPGFLEAPVGRLVSFNDLAPLPAAPVPVEQRAAALRAIQEEIGDCTRCPLAYLGRRSIVFADGDPGARLMFVGEGPGADEDASGIPFVGKAGQLLNNMIQAMGLQREAVYIANIVKCRPPQNRVPEPLEANTCDPFLLRQIDIVQPQVIVALGATAATYLLGVKQSLTSLRGRWHSCRGAKLAVTYHPAFLLRDPRQKGEAWKDLQMVMAELGLQAPARKPAQ
ncbi:MAG: uracil-DNA glycosylase [Acidobacteriota bacterium]|nr:uracil-DNA glycosylase [Acidobacteriota bacterium]